MLFFRQIVLYLYLNSRNKNKQIKKHMGTLITTFFFLLFIRELKLFVEQMVYVENKTDVLNFFGIFISFMGLMTSFVVFW